MASSDPFRHHPELRGKIKTASESFFRELDLEFMDKRAAEAGRPPGWRTPCEDREAARKELLKERWNQDLWVFGFGSLMWDPAMEFAEVRRGKTHEYSRSFCLWDIGGRGSVEQPGLMLAIDEGECCEGLAFRIEAEKLDHETFVLFRREMISGAYSPLWVELETSHGPVEALSFAANHDHERIVPDIPISDQAQMIAHAEGMLGSNFDYLKDTHRHLEIVGVKDPYIEDLYKRVEALRGVDGQG